MQATPPATPLEPPRIRLVGYIAVPQLAQGASMPHAVPPGIAILPSLACKAGEIVTGNPSPCPHKSPGREPGDCGNEGHPACYSA